MLKALSILASVGSALAGTILWDGRMNDFTSSADLNKWSWSNQVGPYQYYIVSPPSPLPQSHHSHTPPARLRRRHRLRQPLAQLQEPRRQRLHAGRQNKPNQHRLLERAEHAPHRVDPADHRGHQQREGLLPFQHHAQRH